MQDLNDMYFFAEVVDRGGFAAAGRALGIPKSKLSRRVSELERRLGVRLLHRTTRKLSLTEAGDLYHRHAVAMREEAEAAEEAVALVQKEPRGTIRVTCPVTLAQTTVGPILPKFLKEHPQVRIEMLVTNRVIDLVDEGVDVALRVRPSVDDSASYIVKKIAPTHSLLVASPELLARVGRPQGPEDLEKLPTVAMSVVDGRTNWPLVGPHGRELTLQHKPSLAADDLLTLRFLVVEGTGMSILPDYLCHHDIREGRMEEVLPGWAPPPSVIHAVFPSRRGLVPAIRRFLDFLGENVTGEGIGCPL